MNAGQEFLRGIVGDKPWFHSMTQVGAVILALGLAYAGLDAQGVAELPYAELVGVISAAIGALLVPTGLRKKSQETADGIAALFADEDDDSDDPDFE
ncbi:MAG TPA: hypothetical protein VM487_15950 [Phycisphaerae bacterium]|nr:hypothetical protein [Phycisphaerae bacterium]